MTPEITPPHGDATAGSVDAAVAVDVLADGDDVARSVAAQIADLFASTPPDRPVVLGCPAGRSPRATYAAFGAEAQRRGLDLRRLRIVMMDEYVEPAGDRFVPVPSDAPHSCRRFAEVELLGALNAAVPAGHRVPVGALSFPDPDAPDEYEDHIARLGGIDLFLLASGSSDGHVAFNPPGSSLDSTTRVVRLADTTRRDNLATFPSFGSLDDVPRHGVTVGLGTIARHSAAVTLLLAGPEKRTTFRRTVDAAGFDPAWPATIVHRCRRARIVADRAAAG